MKSIGKKIAYMGGMAVLIWVTFKLFVYFARLNSPLIEKYLLYPFIVIATLFFYHTEFKRRN